MKQEQTKVVCEKCQKAKPLISYPKEGASNVYRFFCKKCYPE